MSVKTPAMCLGGKRTHDKLTGADSETTDNNTIRIGRLGVQTATFAAGIFGTSVTADAVVVSNIGQLGIVVSLARYKRDIHDMGNSSEALMKLRPVTFR